MSQFEPNEVMINNYIQNKLNSADAEQLEVWLLDHPDVMEELELDIMFKQGVEKQLFKQKNNNTFGFLDFFTSKNLIPIHLLAYALVGLLSYSLLTSKEQFTATYIDLEHVRGSVQKFTVNKHIVFRVFVDDLDKTYQLTMLSKETGETIEYLDLKASNDNSITLVVRQGSSMTGQWNITLVDDLNSVISRQVIELE